MLGMMLLAQLMRCRNEVADLFPRSADESWEHRGGQSTKVDASRYRELQVKTPKGHVTARTVFVAPRLND
jgi:hypothetical protein